MAGGLEPSKGAISHDKMTADKQSPDRTGGGGIGREGNKKKSMQMDMMDTSFVRLRQEIGLFNGMTIIVGCIIGSGIFLSPKSVLENAGSVGMSMVVWVVSGVFSLIGALCFAELGTTILASGGEYSYILFAFGELPAFVLLWATLIIINPTGQAIIALTFANYVMQPFVGDCENPSAGVVQIVAILCLGKIF